MDIQFYGANCISVSYKLTRLVIDDNLKQLGKRSILSKDDVALFTSNIDDSTLLNVKLAIDCPGEFEVADFSIVGIAARAHTDEEGQLKSTMYKITASNINMLVTGHVFPQFSDNQLEAIGVIDVLVIPVGGHGYTLDPEGALTIIKAIEPKIIIPTHYADPSLDYPIPQLSLPEALKGIAMEPKETVSKLKLKSTDLGEVTQLIVLQ
jgi:hypothetical protein